MGEYIKFNGEEIKIGTCENLYYTSFQMYNQALKTGKIQSMFGERPEIYIEPDSGFRFRFPFPDEDSYRMCDQRMDYNRGVPITIDQGAVADFGEGTRPGQTYTMEITQQKLVHRQSDGKLCLALVWRDPLKDESFRIEDDTVVRAILKQIIKHHISNEAKLDTKLFFRKMCFRLLKGYRMDYPKLNVKSQVKKIAPPKRKKGKGL